MKNIFRLSLVLISLLLLVGCGKNVLTLKDEEMNYSVSFSYPSSGDFTIEEEKNSDGKVNEWTLKSKKLNFEADVYFVEYDELAFESTRGNRMAKDNYKDYTFNGKEGYVYSQTNNSLDLLIITDKKEAGRYIVLYMDIDQDDYTIDTDIVKMFDEKEMQDFLNTLTIVK